VAVVPLSPKRPDHWLAVLAIHYTFRAS
jgi:hypothetical protein